MMMSIVVRLLLFAAMLGQAYALIAHPFSRIRSGRVQVAGLRAIKEVIDSAHLESITVNSSSSLPVVIDYQKSRCKPCIRIAPEFIALSEKYDGKVVFYKVDADTSKEALAMMKAQGVRSVPTFHVWHAGERVDTIQGARIDEVEEAFRPIVWKLESTLNATSTVES